MSYNIKPAAEQEVEQAHREKSDECRQQHGKRNVFAGKHSHSPQRCWEKQDIIYNTEHAAALNHHDNHLATT